MRYEYYGIPKELMRDIKPLSKTDETWSLDCFIMGLAVTQRLRYSLTRIAGQYRERFKRTVKPTQVRYRIAKLIEAEFLVMKKEANKLMHKPAVYAFTERVQRYIQRETNWYISPYYLQKRQGNPPPYSHQSLNGSMAPRNTDIANDYTSKSLETHNNNADDTESLLQHYKEEWIEMLGESSETDEFIWGIQALYDKRLMFDRRHAIQDPLWRTKGDNAGHLPTGYFHELIRPLVTGRCQTDPHLFIGKDMLRYIRPAFDPDLARGQIISVDYSDQELRVIAHFTMDQSLHSMASSPQKIKTRFLSPIMDLIEPYDIDPKSLLYAFQYGSRGEKLFDELKPELGYHYARKTATTVIQTLNAEYPTIDALRKSLSEEFTKNGFITAPGGVKRYPIEDDLNKDRSINKTRARSIAFNHFIQGACAWITRKIIAGSATFQYAKLLIPIHDGFVFWIPDDHIQDAIQEISNLLETSAMEVAPTVLMPFELEWEPSKFPTAIYDAFSKERHRTKSLHTRTYSQN